MNELKRQARRPFDLPVGIPELDGQVLPFDVAQLARLCSKA
jgi:hypothetical protein